MDNLLETLRDALESAIYQNRLPCSDKRLRYEAALSLLSTPDALAWALLDEMAAEMVEVAPSRQIFRIKESKTQCFWSTRERSLEGHVADINGRDLILCLARAIREQESREVRDV